MITADEMRRIEKGLKTLNVIWAAMFISLGIYFVVGMAVRDKVTVGMEKGVVDMLRNVLYVVSFIILFATRYATRFLLSGHISSADGGQSSVLARYSTAMLAALAMSESIGIFGLVLFFLGGNESDLYLFLLVSAAAMIAHRPRKDEVLRLAGEMGRRQGR